MTGETHSNDDSDFLDDDFVIENLVDEHDELENLFDPPSEQDENGAEDPSEEHDVLASGDDEDALLFRDHTQGLVTTENFEPANFDEEGPSSWDGELLELEELADSLEQRDAADAAMADPVEALQPQGADAEQALQADVTEVEGDALDGFDAEGAAADGGASLEQQAQDAPGMSDPGEELAVDSEIDLEIVEDDDLEEDLFGDDLDATPAQPAPAPEEEDADAPLDAGLEALAALADDPLQDQDEGSDLFAESADTDDLFDEAAPAPVFGQDAQEFSEGEGLLPDQSAYEGLEDLVEHGAAEASAGDIYAEGDDAAAGWEELDLGTAAPAPDEPGVAAADEEIEYDTSGYEDDEVYGEEGEQDAEAEAYAEDYHAEALERVDGHDIYAEEAEEEVFEVVGGAGNGRRRLWSIAFALAATLLVFSGVAAVALRPAWFGLVAAVEQLAVIEVPRPRVLVSVQEPPQVPVDRSEPAASAAGGAAEPAAPSAPEAQPTVGAQERGGSEEVAPSDPSAGTAQTPTPGSGQVASGETPQAEQVQDPAPTQGQQAAPSGEEPGAIAAGGDQAAARAGAQVAAVDTPQPRAWPVPREEVGDASDPDGALVRFGDGLMVGEAGQATGTVAQAVDGVIQGTRAFAQLHNGNFLVGRVKQIAGETLTLRMEKGEVTIARDDIAKLRRLGTKDFESLKRAKEGFVRLTNNNRLIGGILSEVTDDHIVLEIRRNRVMLPKAEVGEIVDGAEPLKVQLGITREEDQWLRGLAERALGGAQTSGSAATPARPGGQPPR